MIAIRPMSAADIEAIGLCARAADRDEMLAGAGQTIEQALDDGLCKSLRAWVIESGGLPLAAVGDTMAGIGLGVPWMVTTDHILTNPRGFLRASRAILGDMLLRHHMLLNYVDARNVAAIRWLKWLGFTIGEPVPYGVQRLPFRQFSLIRSE